MKALSLLFWDPLCGTTGESRAQSACPRDWTRARPAQQLFLEEEGHPAPRSGTPLSAKIGMGNGLQAFTYKSDKNQAAVHTRDGIQANACLKSHSGVSMSG